VLDAVSKGMWAVKLCTNKIPQFLTGDVAFNALTLLVGWQEGHPKRV